MLGCCFASWMSQRWMTVCVIEIQPIHWHMTRYQPTNQSNQLIESNRIESNGTYHGYSVTSHGHEALDNIESLQYAAPCRTTWPSTRTSRHQGSDLHRSRTPRCSCRCCIVCSIEYSRDRLFVGLTTLEYRWQSASMLGSALAMHS